MPATRAVVPLGARGNALTTNPATSENEGTFQHSTGETRGVMKELLERWARLEEARCTEDYWVALNGFWNWYGEDLRPRDLAVLQAAVQEAIEARGWRWLNGPTVDRASYYCQLQDVSGYPWEGKAPDYQRAAWGKSPAEAILSAYLTALEAQG